MRPLLLILCLTSISISCFSQNNRIIQINWSNDLTIKKDMYESNVLQLAYITSGPSLTKHFLLGMGPESYFGFGLSHVIYTPDWMVFYSRIRFDHPYAGTLSFDLSRLSNSDDGRWLVNSKLSFGVIGPAAGAEWIQTQYHLLFPEAETPNGWDNQVGNKLLLQ